MTRYVTDEDPRERYRLYRLCECDACHGVGKISTEEQDETTISFGFIKCPKCRGEGRIRDLCATATDPESLGVALVTLAREGEFTECPIGILDTEGETGQKWLISPWLPSARNVSDAGRTLQQARKGKT